MRRPIFPCPRCGHLTTISDWHPRGMGRHHGIPWTSERIRADALTATDSNHQPRHRA